LPCSSPRSHDARCVQTSFCHPTRFRLRAPAPRGFPIIESRDFRLALIGEPSVSRRPIRFGGPSGFFSWGGVVFPKLPQVFHNLSHEPYDRTSGTSVASPSLTEWRLRTHWSSSGSPRLHSPRVREDHTMSTTRDAFHRQVIASSGLTPSLVDLATLPPRSDSRRCFARPFANRVVPKFPRGQSTDASSALDPRPRKRRSSS
jgi:hypothetical protein